MTRVVYLPGTSGRGSFWDPVRARVHAIHQKALDWPGLGGNPPDPAVRSLHDVTNMVVGSIDEPCVLVGQSMGGFVATLVALQRPNLVTHLVLAVTSAGIDRGALGLPEWRPGLQPSDSIDVEWVTGSHPSLDDQLAAITVPVLLIWATRDLISPLAIGERLHRLLPSSRLVTFESDDHWVARVEAATVADEINRLLGYKGPPVSRA